MRKRGLISGGLFQSSLASAMTFSFLSIIKLQSDSNKVSNFEVGYLVWSYRSKRLCGWVVDDEQSSATDGSLLRKHNCSPPILCRIIHVPGPLNKIPRVHCRDVFLASKLKKSQKGF